MSDVGRRDFITLLGGAGVAWPPLAARAQQPERMRRVGVLMSPREDDLEAQRRASILRNGLGELGWTEGRNIHIDYRWAAGDAARARAYAMARPSSPMPASWGSKALCRSGRTRLIV
jgi:putative tryptophan/tyrosine transport system substrate-binding protein